MRKRLTLIRIGLEFKQICPVHVLLFQGIIDVERSVKEILIAVTRQLKIICAMLIGLLCMTDQSTICLQCLNYKIQYNVMSFKFP